MFPIAILDTETTGMSPPHDRVIEVAAVIVRDGAVIDSFSELMDPGFPIPGFITGLTGISSAMVRGKPRPEAVLPRLRRFLGDLPVLAHNASFDRRFLDAECAQAGQSPIRQWLCSVLLARRLVPEARSCSLGPLTQQLGIRPPDGHRAHRALADVQMTSEVWRCLNDRCRAALGGGCLDIAGWQALQRVSKAKVPTWLAARCAGPGPQTARAG